MQNDAYEPMWVEKYTGHVSTLITKDYKCNNISILFLKYKIYNNALICV